MNLKRVLNVNPTIPTRIQCSRYSDLDDIVIHKATGLGLPLIGGTALEYWAKITGTTGVRKRSDNDIDFISASTSKITEFYAWLKWHVDPSKVKVDCMLVRSHDFSLWTVLVDGVLLQKPEYLLWSKVTRRGPNDKQDIKWILSIKSLSDEDIQSVLDTLGLTEEESEYLESILSEL